MVELRVWLCRDCMDSSVFFFLSKLNETWPCKLRNALHDSLISITHNKINDGSSMQQSRFQSEHLPHDIFYFYRWSEWNTWKHTVPVVPLHRHSHCDINQTHLQHNGGLFKCSMNRPQSFPVMNCCNSAAGQQCNSLVMLHKGRIYKRNTRVCSMHSKYTMSFGL